MATQGFTPDATPPAKSCAGRFPVVVFLLASGLSLGFSTRALVLATAPPPPRVDFIELLPPDLVTVHFDTEPDREYRLQFIDAVPAPGAPPPVWTDLFVAPAIPFSNHYVVPDTRTNATRVYRLKVTP